MKAAGVPEPQQLGLKPARTGLHWVVWLLRDSGGPMVIQATPWRPGTPEPARDEDWYDEATTVTLVLEPEVTPVRGALAAEELARLRTWVDRNMDLIEDYWQSRVGGIAARNRVRQL